MNIVFLNTLERHVGDRGTSQSAQVSIAEEQGIWSVHWAAPDEQGQQQQDIWYQGISWDEMLYAFRLGLREKVRSGFSPLVHTDLEPAHGLTGKAKMTQMLTYYCEENPNEEMYESLRTWRREQAVREKKAPYILATNRVLRMISVFLPQSKEELLQIPGFGEQKTALYADDILKLIGECIRTNGFPLDWVASYVDPMKFDGWLLAQKEQKLRMELDREVSKRKLLEIVAGGGSLADLQAQLTMPRRELLLWVEELDREGYDMDPLVEAELTAIPEEEQIKAWNSYESEGDRYLKPVLKSLTGTEELKGKELDRAYEWLRLLRLRFRREKEKFTSQAAS
ncbi:HRDC domain-containing protein [Paenibacillus roseipurpureus]|uniref:HRDC domain-containing protein n=1 Tax=Paenibacillus roseopurpureus TaxID=2918901 RepID=A0AA96RLV3_9BACL|nr:HRDC domain-containing protein [Paenibacillus sp. MBLB1832]WNR43567.1 HRDC domain-containing protein [Paenibacillus sp. MBLB1832]